MEDWKYLYLKKVDEITELLKVIKDLQDQLQPRALTDKDKKRILSDFYDE